RKALTMGIDRYTAGRVLYPIASLRDVGGLMRPATEWAMAESDLQKLPGFWKDAEKSRAEAKRLLAEAGYPNGFKVVLKNRNVRVPYIDFGVFVIQEWRKIGIEAEHRPLETAAWFADGRDQGNFEVIVNGTFNYMDDPDLFLERYTSGDTNNWGRFSDPRIDDLFARQARTLDPAERKRLTRGGARWRFGSGVTEGCSPSPRSRSWSRWRPPSPSRLRKPRAAAGFCLR